MLTRIAACTCSLLLALPPAVLAAPSGEVIVEGHADFGREGNTTTIDTATEQTIIEYDSFDILQGEAVVINQPTDTSRTFNHVPNSGDPTLVDGSLDSNGFVYILNPAGVFMGGHAVVDVGGLVAAAGKMDYEDFREGRNRFTDLSGDVRVAEGAEITARDGIALIGRRVENFGTVVSEAGMVAFVAGSDALIGSLDGHMIVRVDEFSGGGGALPPEAGFALTQGGTVESGGGGVVLTAGDTYSLAMNHTGLTRGRDVRLEAQGDGLVQVSGEIDASDGSEGATGGRVRVLGDRVAILDARIDASGDAGGGEILVGGDVRGGGDVRTSRRTYVGPDAELVADAVTRGDGGKIVVWAEEKTGFYGSASARGGEESGDGGFIEISGREYLDTGGHHIDLSAPNGRSGTLLYDPNVIEIRGGTGPDALDGSDADPAPPEDDAEQLNNGTLGRILEGETGQNGEGVDEPFVIYESEIEGTDANIILQALQQIRTQEGAVFDANDVVIIDGNSLVMQVTGNPDLPDGEYAIDLDPGLTWRVTGGAIYIATEVGDASVPEAEGLRGDIRVGHLEWRPMVGESNGLEFPELFQVDSNELGVSPLGAVTVSTVVGDILLAGNIDTSGFDAEEGRVAGHPFDPNPQLEGDLRFSAGDVFVTAQSGEIDVDGNIDAVGGSAGDASAPSLGGDGGDVTILTNDGEVRVRGDIDVSGGDGRGGFVDVVNEDGEEGEFGFIGNGGFGGDITLAAGATQEDSTGDVVVEGDLTARGGLGQGFIINASQTFAGVGGRGGQIFVNAENGIEVELATFDASGGDGTGGGGSAVGSEAVAAIELLITPDDAALADGAILLTDVALIADGGDATAGGPGGAGGNAGSVFLRAGSLGTVDATNVEIRANGGDGVGGTAGPGLRSGFGGSGAPTILVTGGAGVSFTDSTITSLGGTGVNGNGGIGGDVDIDSSGGNVLIDDIDVSGGDATAEDEDSGAVSGGRGGRIFVDAGTTEGDEGEPPTGGEIVLSGRLAAFGGTGDDTEGGMPVAAGGTVDLASDVAIRAAAASTPELFGGILSLAAPSIGAGGTITIGGTDADGDIAILQSGGTIDADVDSLEGALETVRVVHTESTAETHLTGDVILDVIPDDGMDEPQTIERMESGDGGPALEFVLDAIAGEQAADGADLRILRGAGLLGSAGGAITNDDGAIIGETAGADPHLTITDDDADTPTLLTLTAASIGTSSDPIEIDGDGDAELVLDSRGGVYVDVIAQSLGPDSLEGFGAIDLTLRNPASAVIETRTQDEMQSESIEVTELSSGPEDPDPAVSLTGSTLMSGADLEFDLLVPVAAAANPARVDVHDLELGGSGRIGASGDVVLVDAGGASIAYGAGHTLVLEAGAGSGSGSAGDVTWAGGTAAIEIRDGDPGADTAGLVLLADGGSVGGPGDGPLVTRVTGGAVEQLEIAGGAEGAFRVQNEDGADVVITEFELPARQGEEPRVVRGISAAGDGADVSIGNAAGDIVLGELLLGSSAAVARHVDADGDVELVADAIRIENAQFVVPPVAGDDGGLEEGDPVAVNSAGIFSRGDVRFAGTIDTADDAVAVAGEGVGGDDPPEDTFVHADLVVSARGDTTYEGDVGTDVALARLDTTHAVTPLGTADDDVRTFHVGEAIFRGGLDGSADAGAADVEVTGAAEALALEEDATTSASFGGNVGGRTALGALTVEADRIAFAIDGDGSAEQVVAQGDIHLDTQQSDSDPRQVATITDTAGSLSIRSNEGSFSVGALDRLSVTGDLAIRAAGTVRVADLSASSISVTAPSIMVMNDRAAGEVLLPDGTTTTDGGVDWVANDIALSSAPMASGDEPLRFFLGSGGIRVPGGIDAYDVRRLDASFARVGRASFFGPDGEVLDLTGGGPPLVADASRDMPRPEPAPVPVTLPRFGTDPPAPAAPLGADAVLAFLRCSGVGSASGPGACSPSDEATLAGVGRLRDTPLATPRAEEITERYRALVTAPGAAERLRAAFAEAGEAFADTREWRDGTLDGADLYRFLASAPRGQRDALAAVHELAWLHAELELLGLAGDDTRRLQRTLAQDFADAAGLTGLTADAVSAAVQESPIGLPEKP